MTEDNFGLADTAEVTIVRARPCDACDEGLPLVDGWHEREDPEGIEGTQRIPCMRERSA